MLGIVLDMRGFMMGPGGPPPPEISKIFINFYLLANVIFSIKIWNALN